MLGFIVVLCFLCANAQRVSEDILCENRYFEPNCVGSGTVRIISASYGKTDATICGGKDTNSWSVNCGVDVADYLRQSCQGKTNCSVRVEGQDVCPGTSKYLQVIWACDNGISQNRVNNRGTNIVISSSPSRSAPLPLHASTVSGNQNYIFLDPNVGISQVRWYLDQPGQVLATESVSPFDFRGGQAWNSTTMPDGQHRVIAALTFTDGASGSIDATFNIRNAPNQQPVRAAAVSKSTNSYEEGSTSNSSESNGILPWSLVGAACGIIVILIVVVIVVGKVNTADDTDERA